MRFVSTRGAAPAVSIEPALLAVLAPDGGLYVPEAIPEVPLPAPGSTLADTARVMLAPYLTGASWHARLPAMCAQAFAFPAPLRALRDPRDFVLELFHGPTAAFKDFAARFLAEALAGMRVSDTPPTTVLVATSGDTGAAVAAAFHRRAGFRVAILYPDGRVSPRQAHGLGCWGDNVRAYRVAGSFDDCQRLVKQALADADLRACVRLGSANSISLGRLLPQIGYHAHAALGFFAQHGRRLNLIVPTGNLGNACAAVLAQRMGAPIGRILLATNANDVLPRFFSGADYAGQPTRATLANAMDVGAPSNFERLRRWHRDDAHLRSALSAHRVDDAMIRASIRAAPARHGIVPCPHTATALHVLEQLRAAGDAHPYAIVATAHPGKFEAIVEPLVGHRVELPPALVAALARPSRAEPLPVEYAALCARLREDRGG